METKSPVLALYGLATRMRLPERCDLPKLGLAGLLGISLYHIALNFGEVTVNAGAASLLSSFLYLSPVLASLIAWLWLGEVPALLTILGGAIAIVGVILVQTRGTRIPTSANVC